MSKVNLETMGDVNSYNPSRAKCSIDIQEQIAEIIQKGTTRKGLIALKLQGKLNAKLSEANCSMRDVIRENRKDLKERLLSGKQSFPYFIIVSQGKNHLAVKRVNNLQDVKNAIEKEKVTEYQLQEK